MLHRLHLMSWKGLHRSQALAVGALSDAQIDGAMYWLTHDLGVWFMPYRPARRPDATFSQLFVTFIGVQERLLQLEKTLFHGVPVHIKIRTPLARNRA